MEELPGYWHKLPADLLISTAKYCGKFDPRVFFLVCQDWFLLLKDNEIFWEIIYQNHILQPSKMCEDLSFREHIGMFSNRILVYGFFDSDFVPMLISLHKKPELTPSDLSLAGYVVYPKSQDKYMIEFREEKIPTNNKCKFVESIDALSKRTRVIYIGLYHGLFDIICSKNAERWEPDYCCEYTGTLSEPILEIFEKTKLLDMLTVIRLSNPYHTIKSSINLRELYPHVIFVIDRGDDKVERAYLENIFSITVPKKSTDKEYIPWALQVVNTAAKIRAFWPKLSAEDVRKILQDSRKGGWLDHDAALIMAETYKNELKF